MIYFDNSATSPVDEEVYEAMLPYLMEEYGNPSSKYYCKAVNAKNAVEEAREKVAALINAKSEEIIFTAGATESTNLIIKGYTDYEKYYGSGGNHIITSLAEHKATLNTCKYLNGEIYSNQDSSMSLFAENKKVDRGYEVSFVGVDQNGLLLIEQFEDAIKESTILASFIYVNNEVGSINDIEKVSHICRDHRIAFHTDVTQALGKIPIDVTKLGEVLTDNSGVEFPLFMSFSAHKIYGPKGVGAAYLRADDYGLKPISALLHGGEQENGVRAGTLAVHNIVGFGKAAEIAKKNMDKDSKRIKELDEYLVEKIRQTENLQLTNDSRRRMSGIVSIFVQEKNFNNERFIKKISEDVALSTGSACSVGEPSYVLKAMGLGEQVMKVLRISLNRYTTKEDVDYLMNILQNSI